MIDCPDCTVNILHAAEVEVVVKKWRTAAEEAVQTTLLATNKLVVAEEAAGRSLRRAESVDHALREACEALESLWAAIGDALCSGSGIEEAYAQSVATRVKAAADKGRAVSGWAALAGKEGT